MEFYYIIANDGRHKIGFSGRDYAEATENAINHIMILNGINPFGGNTDADKTMYDSMYDKVSEFVAYNLKDEDEIPDDLILTYIICDADNHTIADSFDVDNW